MTIKVISAQARTNVLWLGEAVPNDTRLLIERFQFSIDTASPASALSDDGFLGGLAAVVFSQRETKPLPTVTDLKAYVARLLDFDCLVLVFAANSGLSSVKKALTRLRITAIWPTAGPEMEVFDCIRVLRH